MNRPGLLCLAAGPVLGFALAGCAHVADREAFDGFARAAGEVHAQADLAFAAANASSRRAGVDAFVATGRPGITERAFPPAVDADAAAAWDAALSDLERYGALLAGLLDKGRGARTSSAVARFGRELGQASAGARIRPGVGAGFAALAGALIDASAERSARAVVRTADPAVRRTLEAMAEAVGRDRSDGLQAVVWSNWTVQLAAIRDRYADAAGRRDGAAQRSLAAEFMAAVDRRDADLRALASLRASLIGLADAHAAAAADAAPTQAAVLDGIERRLSEARRDMDVLRGGAR